MIYADTPHMASVEYSVTLSHNVRYASSFRMSWRFEILLL